MNGGARQFGGALLVSALIHVAIATSWLRARAAAAEPEPVPAPVAMAPLTGETFDLGNGEAPETPSPAESTSTGSPGDNGATTTATHVAPRLAKRAALSTGPSTEPGTESAGATAAGATVSAPSLYGAVGDRAAVDFVPAFQRAFAQTASADPSWQSAALGSNGATSLAIVLDDTGHIASTSIAPGASAALGSSVQRTLALLAHRAFIAHGARTTLRLSAVVTADTVHDGLHGDRFALGVGETAWFALPSGRRIDLKISAR